MRLTYPANIRIIRTPCTGKLEVEYFLKAFEKGADGIVVAGCEEGACHFIEGNLLAKRRVAATRQLLDEAGFQPDRLQMVNISAAMGRRFAEIMQEVAAQMQALGPSPLRKVNRMKAEGRRRAPDGAVDIDGARDTHP